MSEESCPRCGSELRIYKSGGLTFLRENPLTEVKRCTKCDWVNEIKLVENGEK